MGRVLDIYQDARDATWHALLTWDVDVTRALMASPIPYSDIGQRLPTVRRANTRARAALERWLSVKSVALTDPAGGDDPGSEEDARTRVLAAIVKRQGQPAFRNRLLHHYDRRCAVTGAAVEQVLEAAHITPYLGSHSNVTGNGLLLRSDLHTLFDLFLISVDAMGGLLVSARLAKSPYAALAGQPLHQPTAATGRPSKQRLARHRREFMAREKL